MQKWTSVISGALFVVVGLPVAYITTFIFHMDIFGFWIGVIVAEMFTIVLLFVLLHRFDWSTYSQETFDRMAKESLEHFTLIASNKNNNDESELLLSRNRIRIEESEMTSVKNTSKQSVMKLIRIKLAVFLLFLSLFVVSAVFNFR